MSAPARSLASQEAPAYLAAVERELDDLPVDERTALVEDLAQHLAALATEDDDRPIEQRLGSPVAYATDLRSAAGLPARPGSPPRPTALRDRLVSVSSSPAVREVLRLLRELRPAWWVLRGYLLVLVPCLLDSDGVRDFPVPAPLGSHPLGVLLVVLAVVGSVALGRRGLPRPARALVAALGVVLVAATAAVAQSELQQQAPGWTSASAPYPSASGGEVAVGASPLVSRYGPVTDVLPYAADGTPLEGVLLFDQDGRPLKVGFQQWWADGCVRVRDQPRAADGVPVPNSYPQVYEPTGSGVDGALVPAGQCVEDRPRPDVPLPVFPAEGRDRELAD